MSHLKLSLAILALSLQAQVAFCESVLNCLLRKGGYQFQLDADFHPVEARFPYLGAEIFHRCEAAHIPAGYLDFRIADPRGIITSIHHQPGIISHVDLKSFLEKAIEAWSIYHPDCAQILSAGSPAIESKSGDYSYLLKFLYRDKNQVRWTYRDNQFYFYADKAHIDIMIAHERIEESLRQDPQTTYSNASQRHYPLLGEDAFIHASQKHLFEEALTEFFSVLTRE